MKSWALSAMAVVTAVGALTACSSASSTGGTGGSGGGSGGGKASSSSTGSSSSQASSSSASSSSGSSTSTSTSSGGMMGAECAMQATKKDCFTCCAMDFPAADALLNTDFLQNCACAAGSPCIADAACVNDCKVMTASQTCATCINTKALMVNDKCGGASLTACAGDAKCQPLVGCLTANCKQAN